MVVLALAVAVEAQTPEMLKRVELATASEREAIRLNPRSAEAYRSLAEAYRGQKFLRAAAGALSTAVALSPSDEAGHRELGTLLRRVGDPAGAIRAFHAALKLQPSAEAHLHLSYLSTEAEERERHVRAALQLTPRSPDIYLRLAQLFGEDKAAPPRKAEAEAAFRELVQLDPVMGGQRLFNFLRFEERKLEAAVAFRGAKLLVEERRQAEAEAAEDEAACAEEKAAEKSSVSVGSQGEVLERPRPPLPPSSPPPPPLSPPTSPPLARNLEEWRRYVDDVAAGADSAPPKCLSRRCIEGLDVALSSADGGTKAAEVSAEQLDRNTIHRLLQSPAPTVLRSATVGWAPLTKWDAAYLSTAAGEEELEVTVVTTAGAFEVRHDRIERPPKSTMRVGDYMRWLALKRDLNLTLYSRQGSLWPMSGLLADMAPLPWMETLRLVDLNFWLGDGHFRNTMHFE